MHTERIPRRILSLFLTAALHAGCSSSQPPSPPELAGPIAADPPGPPPGASAEGTSCVMEPCNGLELTCALKPPQICTMIYKLGDFCRQYAKCERHGDSCELAADPKLAECKACVAPCTGPDAHACEQRCRAKLGPSGG